MSYTAILLKDPDGGYVAQNPETATSTQGDTPDEALANLREATVKHVRQPSVSKQQEKRQDTPPGDPAFRQVAKMLPEINGGG